LLDLTLMLTEPRIGHHRHIALQTMQTRTSSFAPAPTRSLSKYDGISARVSPTCNLTDLYNYYQRSAYVGFPCNGLALSKQTFCLALTIATLHQWHLFLPHATHILPNRMHRSR